MKKYKIFQRQTKVWDKGKEMTKDNKTFKITYSGFPITPYHFSCS